MVGFKALGSNDINLLSYMENFFFRYVFNFLFIREFIKYLYINGGDLGLGFYYFYFKFFE